MRLAPAPADFRGYRRMNLGAAVISGTVAVLLGMFAIGLEAPGWFGLLVVAPVCAQPVLFLLAAHFLEEGTSAERGPRAGLILGLLAGTGWGLCLAGALLVYASRLAEGRGVPRFDGTTWWETALLWLIFLGVFASMGVPLLTGALNGLAWWRLRTGRTDEPPSHPR